MTVSFAAASERPGRIAPPIKLPSLDGRLVDTSLPPVRPLVLLFADAGQQHTLEAFRRIAAALADRDVDGRFRWIAIFSKSSDPRSLDLAGVRPAPRVVHDTRREAFGAYAVVVAPTVVVVDEAGRVVHTVKGLTDRFDDAVADAVSRALGQLTDEEFERALQPEAAALRDETHMRLQRRTSLALRLASRGLNTQAEPVFRAVLGLDPTFVPARLGLAELLLQTGRLDEAEGLFESVRAEDPADRAATAGLATVYALGGEGRTNDAETLARLLLQDDRANARAHYVLGLVYQQRGEAPNAAASFRRAAEILLRQVTSVRR